MTAKTRRSRIDHENEKRSSVPLITNRVRFQAAVVIYKQTPCFPSAEPMIAPPGAIVDSHRDIGRG